MTTATKDLIRLGVAAVLALTYPMLMYLTLAEGASLKPFEIAAYLFLIALFLRDLESVTELVEAWKE